MSMKPDLKELMEQAQIMQQNMQKAQKELADLTVIGQAGGGLVKVHMTGHHRAKKVEIAFSLMDDDKEVLEDLVVAAINDASQSIEKRSQEKIMSLTQGLKLPPDFQVPPGGGEEGT